MSLTYITPFLTDPRQAAIAFQRTGQTVGSVVEFFDRTFTMPRDQERLARARLVITDGCGELPQLAVWMLDNWVLWDCDPRMAELLRIFHADDWLPGTFSFRALMDGGVPEGYVEAAVGGGVTDTKAIVAGWRAGAPVEYLMTAD